MKSEALATRCEPHSQPTEPQSKTVLIREWIVKLALNAGQELDVTAVGVYEALWNEGFEDLAYSVLKAAFKKTLKTCKYWPVKVADIREHVTQAERNATTMEADNAWQRVLKLRRLFWNPDMPGGFSRGMPRLDERTEQAARAAGVFRDHDSLEALHVWVKKKFIESYIAWGELMQDEFLLPEGELRDLLADAAQKLLPRSASHEEGRAPGITSSKEPKTPECNEPEIQPATCEIVQEAKPRPPKLE